MNITYTERLKDARWAERKATHLQRNCRCMRCGSKERLNVHHRKYRAGAAPWEYSEDELLTLCEDCHAGVHIAEMKAKAFAISLSSEDAELFESLIDTLVRLPDSRVAVALARAESAVNSIRYNAEPRLIGEILDELATRQSTKILR